MQKNRISLIDRFKDSIFYKFLKGSLNLWLAHTDYLYNYYYDMNGVMYENGGLGPVTIPITFPILIVMNILDFIIVCPILAGLKLYKDQHQDSYLKQVPGENRTVATEVTVAPVYCTKVQIGYPVNAPPPHSNPYVAGP